MRLIPAVVSCSALLAGCALGADSSEAGWIDERLREGPRAEAPAYIERDSLSSQERGDLGRDANLLIERRDEVKAAAERLLPPTVDTAEFVVEARARALPPPR